VCTIGVLTLTIAFARVPVAEFVNTLSRTALTACMALLWFAVAEHHGVAQSADTPLVEPATAEQAETDDSGDDEPELPEPPPAFETDAVGDTIYLARGSRITGVIIVRRTPLAITYDGFFDHPTVARIYSRSIPTIEVAKFELSSEQDHARLRAAWERQVALVAKYNDEIKQSGLVMFRGEWMKPDRAASLQRTEQETERKQWAARAEQRRAAAQRARERAQTVADEQRRQIAASLRLGQNASVLNMFGPPTSRRELPLGPGIVQLDLSWASLGLRVIVQNGVIAFVERFQPVPNPRSRPSTTPMPATPRVVMQPTE